VVAPPLAAIVEITADAAGRLPVELIRAAYLASRAGTVVFVLVGVRSAAVDRVLDEVVPTARDVRGVLYSTTQDLDRLISDRGRPLVALGSAEALCRTLRRHHLDPRPVLHAADLIAALEEAAPRSRKRARP
jgi:hypothetical protein